MRAKGVVVTLPDKEPRGVLANEAKKIQHQRQERKIISKPSPPPNWKCYTMLFKVGVNIDANGNWLGRSRLPRCNRCHGVLSPREHHVCPGYAHKYKERTQEDWENIESKRRERRQERSEARWEREHEEFDEAAWEQRTVECRRCSGEIHGIDDPHECPEDIDSDSSEEDQ
jgi:hypothetical protein